MWKNNVNEQLKREGIKDNRLWDKGKKKDILSDLYIVLVFQSVLISKQIKCYVIMLGPKQATRLRPRFYFNPNKPLDLDLDSISSSHFHHFSF